MRNAGNRKTPPPMARLSYANSSHDIRREYVDLIGFKEYQTKQTTHKLGARCATTPGTSSASLILAIRGGQFEVNEMVRPESRKTPPCGAGLSNEFGTVKIFADHRFPVTQPPTQIIQQRMLPKIKEDALCIG